MTNGTGKQSETIHENIFRKYGRYQVHPRDPKPPTPEPSDLDKIKMALLAKVAPETLTKSQLNAFGAGGVDDYGQKQALQQAQLSRDRR